MGRSVKFPNIPRVTKATGVLLPVGNTAQRPSSPISGTMRYNTDTSKFELYQNGTWINPTSRGKVTVTKDTFTGDGSTVAFTMATSESSANGVQVFVGNVHQNATVSYSVSSTTLTFNAAPNPGQTIEVYHGFDSTDR